MKHLLSVPDCEDEKTLELFRKFAAMKRQGYLTKSQLIEILKWKSPRPLRFYEVNSETEVREITRLAFATRNDRLKVHILTALKGVNIPAASAILMFYDRKKFPVIDIRVWQQLHKAKLVKTNQKGKGFKLAEWEIYLNVIRNIGTKNNLTARQVEKRIFDIDRQTRKGNLYQ